jgi:hypothetical protein
VALPAGRAAAGPGDSAARFLLNGFVNSFRSKLIALLLFLPACGSVSQVASGNTITVGVGGQGGPAGVPNGMLGVMGVAAPSN